MDEIDELKSQINELKNTIMGEMADLKAENKELKNKIDTMNDKLDKLLELFEIQSTDCKKMSEHIDFVETVYERVKHPFNYIMNAVSPSSYAITE